MSLKLLTVILISLSEKSLSANPNTQLMATTSQKKAEPTIKQTIEPPAAPAAKPVVIPAKVASVAKSSKVSSTGHATVDMIDFQVVEGLSRVSIKVSGKIEVKPPTLSAGFVTLNINNCVLPKQLQRSIDSKGFASPVLRVTPILIKTRKGTDTKIRIAMRKTAPFEFKQEGDMIYVDFKNPEGLETIKVPLVRGGSSKKSSPISTELANEMDLNNDEPVKISGSDKHYKGRKVTLEFADAEVRKIFQLLSEVSNKNFVLGDDVVGSISIKLVNVPWDQALDIILDTKGLDKREDGNIIIIKGKGKFKSQAEEELEIKKQKYKSTELVTATYSVNYSDIKDIVTQFNALKTERGSVSPDERTNKIFVKDTPQVIEDMRRILAQLDIPEKQVMIEARIVEATSSFVRSLGVSWGVHYLDGSASLLGINAMDTGFGGLTSVAPPTTGTNTTAGGTMGISFGSLTSNIRLDMRLNAAASAGLIKIVSSPKVATLNNKTAKISQGQQIPYQNTTATTGAVTQFVAAVLSLEVTPHINANGTIGMKIIAKNDAPGASTGAIPPINTKSATTELLMKDGETTVIGGIYVDNETESDDGVPFLMDIPLLGKLFKTNRIAKTRTELLIFITPRILGSI